MLLRLLKAWLPAAVVCVAIFLFSQDAHSGRHSNEVLSWMLDVLGANTHHWHRLLNGPFRKFAHVVVYFLLGATAYRGFALDRRDFDIPAALRTLAFCALYAGSDEFHQTLIPGRGGSLRDVGIDTSASLVALLLIWLWLSLRRPRHRQAMNAVPEPDIHCSGGGR